MTIRLRQMSPLDLSAWAEMRARLWPEGCVAEHTKDIADILGSEDYWGFLAETSDGAPVGFAEVAIRKYANGCETRPVAFLEGVWVAPELRRQRVGARLVQHVEEFVRRRGFREIGSDALADNEVGIASHCRWGFAETERVVYFRKDLTG
jgi:aminoglycoside 6'-N-acetyltransferase I